MPPVLASKYGFEALQVAAEVVSLLCISVSFVPVLVPFLLQKELDGVVFIYSDVSYAFFSIFVAAMVRSAACMYFVCATLAVLCFHVSFSLAKWCQD